MCVCGGEQTLTYWRQFHGAKWNQKLNKNIKDAVTNKDYAITSKCIFAKNHLKLLILWCKNNLETS